MMPQLMSWSSLSRFDSLVLLCLAKIVQIFYYQLLRHLVNLFKETNPNEARGEVKEYHHLE